ncbi:G2/mitotic-specific cyclin-B1-like [Puntigrus tetrazona]|uniref:G2/mitotic-specific cyclin-B1-like n=1 Tax=Puntigrus tetrazona TaxID=1606681 RepID=UPI001C89AAA2|nr:G2/mitotic-specific cyclin-B1-like [Puntigrus tetrazona]
MSPPVTRASSRLKQLRYSLRSRAPLGNASNLISVHRGDEEPKGTELERDRRQKAARVKKDGLKSKRAAAEPPSAPNQNLSEERDAVEPPAPRAPTLSGPGRLQEPPDAPQTFSILLLNIPDVDSADAGDAQMCSEYVCDIYAYLQQLEVAMAIRPCHLEGQEVSGGMRAVSIDWVMQVQREFRLSQETLFMTVGIIDRFLQNNPVPRKYLQLLCVTAMLLASKYEELYPPTVGDFAFVTDGAYSCGDIRRMERIVLKRLNYSLGRPLPSHFLQRVCKIGQAGPRERELASFLTELMVLDYDLVHVPPSLTQRPRL